MYSQFGRGMMSGGPQMMGGDLGFGGFQILAMVGFFIVAAAIVALIVWAIARRSAHPHASVPASGQDLVSADAALAIARERLARGEIDPDQYTAIASALVGPPAAPAVVNG